MYEIRCKSCHRLLGKFDGKGEIKCRCKSFTTFDTEKKSIECEIRTDNIVKHADYPKMRSRTTSSGTRFE